MIFFTLIPCLLSVAKGDVATNAKSLRTVYTNGTATVVGANYTLKTTLSTPVAEVTSTPGNIPATPHVGGYPVANSTEPAQYATVAGAICNGQFRESTSNVWTDTPALGIWAKTQYEMYTVEYPSEDDKVGMPFGQWLRKLFAPNIAGSAYNCRVDMQCSVGAATCELYP